MTDKPLHVYDVHARTRKVVGKLCEAICAQASQEEQANPLFHPLLGSFLVAGLAQTSSFPA